MPAADLADAALAPLPAPYRQLYARLRAAVLADDRVRAMWLSGSAGRGAADAGSDLDVVLAVSPARFDEFAAHWRDWLMAVTPVVLAGQIPGLRGSWFSLTPQCLRLDVVTERAGSADGTALTGRLLVLDKDHAYRAVRPASDEPAVGPDAVRLTSLTSEFFRQLAIFPAAVVARADWLLGVEAVRNIQLMLYQLFVESNQPLPPMGVKQWSAKLTAAQRQTCASLPAPAAGRDSVLAAMRAATDEFLAAARPVLSQAGAPWPAELETAVRRYLKAELGWPA
jgi:hypothetical protein